MDGLDNNDEIIVIGATNRYELLDEALIRPGRFSFKVNVELPEFEERKHIYKHYFKLFHSDIFEDKILEEFSIESKNFSGADIEGIVNEVVSKSVIQNNQEITKENVIEIIKANAKFKIDYISNKFNRN
jgi:cell division protease FtsH